MGINHHINVTELSVTLWARAVDMALDWIYYAVYEFVE